MHGMSSKIVASAPKFEPQAAAAGSPVPGRTVSD